MKTKIKITQSPDNIFDGTGLTVKDLRNIIKKSRLPELAETINAYKVRDSKLGFFVIECETLGRIVIQFCTSFYVNDNDCVAVFKKRLEETRQLLQKGFDEFFGYYPNVTLELKDWLSDNNCIRRENQTDFLEYLTGIYFEYKIYV